MKRGKASKKKSVAPKKKVSKTEKISKKKVSKKTKLTNKQWLTISIVAFLVFAFALAFVNVPQNASVTGRQIETGEGSGVESAIKDLFTNVGDDLDNAIGKYVIWFTLLAFVMGGLSFISFPENGFLRFLIALGVSFLASAYLLPEYVSTIIMGMEVGSLMLMFVPFAGVILISAMLVSTDKYDKMNSGRVAVQFLLLLIWFGLVVFRLIRAWIDEGFMFLIKGAGIVLVIIGVLTLVLVAFNKGFRKIIASWGKEIRERKAEIRREAMAAREREGAELVRAGEEKK